MTMADWTTVPALVGVHVRLEPLRAEHGTALQVAVRDGELWRCWYGTVPDPEAMDGYIETALQMQQHGTALPFVVRDAQGAIVGTTRFYDITRDVPRLNIGYTWYARRAQRTGINTEAKLLLLGHAFDTLGCIAVGFKTSWFNQPSRTALARLGAKQDGVMRHHLRHRDGSIRDTVLFSILDAEWPAVRRHLQARLEAYA